MSTPVIIRFMTQLIERNAIDLIDSSFFLGDESKVLHVVIKKNIIQNRLKSMSEQICSLNTST